MKPCKNCGAMLADDAAYCTICNVPQNDGFGEFEVQPRRSDSFLKVLCILTIVGAGFSLIGSGISLASGAQMPIENMRMLTYAGIGIALGKLTGAILMLTKKLTGLYIYTATAVAGLAVQSYSVSTTSAYSEKLMAGSSAFVWVSAAIACLIVIGFIVMYWLPVNRRHLS